MKTAAGTARLEREGATLRARTRRIGVCDLAGAKSGLRTVVGMACLGAAASCSSVGSEGAPEPPGLAVSPLFANDVAACNYFVDKGLTRIQAAGIIGNLDQESGMDPKAVQQGGLGRGIAQWSAGGRWDTDPGDNAADYAEQRGQSVWSLQLQLDFIWYELTTFSGFGLQSLRAATTIASATIAFEEEFERCGTCQEATRIAYAQDILGSCTGNAVADYMGTSLGVSGQSYPVASQSAVQVRQGDTVSGWVKLKNTGRLPWAAGKVWLAPIPRDQPSPFRAPSWFSDYRISTPAHDIAPGETAQFELNITGHKLGQSSLKLGWVADPAIWFADPPKGGGPPDGYFEVVVNVLEPLPPQDGGRESGGTSDAAVGDSRIGDSDGGGRIRGDSGSFSDSGSLSDGGAGGASRNAGMGGQSGSEGSEVDGGSGAGGQYVTRDSASPDADSERGGHHATSGAGASGRSSMSATGDAAQTGLWTRPSGTGGSATADPGARPRQADDDGGCSCSFARPIRPAPTFGVYALVALALALRRRRPNE